VAHRPDAQRERPLRALPIPTISSSSATRREEVQHVKPAPSLLLNKLNSLHRASTTLEEERASTRSTSFAKPAVVPSPNAARPIRDDTLAIIETLEMGPIEHNPPTDDVEFEALEPYSGIRLKFVPVVVLNARRNLMHTQISLSIIQRLPRLYARALFPFPLHALQRRPATAE
jgi:hypothetical protein